MKKIVYRSGYISQEFVQEIRDYYENINDSLMASSGPYDSSKAKLGWMGCWDRQLHHELPDAPVHQLVSMLKKDFGDFEIYESSIRYLSAPVLPHSDIRDVEWLRKYRKDGYREGFIFLIPLWWEKGYQPATAFLNSPACLDEPLYQDMLDVLPNYSDLPENNFEQKNFSVRSIIKWEKPGDLIGWENFQWHASCQFGKANYTRNRWVKEFVSVETMIKM